MKAIDEEAADFAAVAELAECFAGLVDALMEGDRPQELPPERIIALAERCFPTGQHFALLSVKDGHTRVMAETGDVPARLDRLRDELGEGPALDVLDTTDLIVSNDLAGDPRWPRFGPAAVERVGIRSAIAYRLYITARTRTALAIYSDWPYAFNEVAITTGSIFAAYCSLIATFDQVIGDGVSARRGAEAHRETRMAARLIAAQGVTTVEAYRRFTMAARTVRSSLPSVAKHVIRRRGGPEQQRPAP